MFLLLKDLRYLPTFVPFVRLQIHKKNKHDEPSKDDL
jgi:hypothetical protein